MIKLKKVILFIIFYNFFFVLHATALNNSIVFKINNSIITQIDVEQELAYLKTLDQKVKDIGKTGSFKGPYWEMTNVKLALVVKSTMEGNTDYVYVSENERIQLTSAEKASLAKEFNQFLKFEYK